VTVVPLDGGGSGSGAGLTADDVRAHVEEKVEWVDPQKQPWSCVDGRATQPGLTTPAGDSGEFILGLVAYVPCRVVSRRVASRRVVSLVVSCLMCVHTGTSSGCWR
jgi:hypothetical protein